MLRLGGRERQGGRLISLFTALRKEGSTATGSSDASDGLLRWRCGIVNIGGIHAGPLLASRYVGVQEPRAGQFVLGCITGVFLAWQRTKGETHICSWWCPDVVSPPDLKPAISSLRLFRWPLLPGSPSHRLPRLPVHRGCRFPFLQKSLVHQSGLPLPVSWEVDPICILLPFAGPSPRRIAWSVCTGLSPTVRQSTDSG